MDFERKKGEGNLGNVLVLGKGVTGRALSDYLSLISDRTSSVDIADGEDIDTSKHYDLCIASPGISVNSELFSKADSISNEVISEVEFAWRESEEDSLWVAITGTNGKTTTTSLITHILKLAGKNAVAVGNIGDTCISKVDGTPKVYVAECSSYQLTLTKDFCPKAACILNITPDHLIWHGSFENYRDAKYKIFQNTKDMPDGLVFVDDETCTSCNLSKATARIETYSSTDATSLVDCVLDDMIIKGSHNRQNAICAVEVCMHLGIDTEVIVEGLKTFHPLEHRIEPCGAVGGVEYFNDSKATNVDSSIAALSAFAGKEVIVMFGGKDKMSDLSPLVEACTQKESEKSPKVVGVICYGAARARFFDAFQPLKDEVALYECDTFGDAFCLASSVASSGQSVLLSPACASFDEFSCFEERGEAFKAAVEDLKAKGAKTEE